LWIVEVPAKNFLLLVGFEKPNQTKPNQRTKHKKTLNPQTLW